MVDESAAMRPASPHWNPRSVAVRRRAAASLAGSVVVCAVMALILASAGVANAAVPVPLVSSSMSFSGGGATVTAGTTLTVAFNRAPALAGSYSLTLTDGSDVGALSTAAGNLTAVASGSSVVFTVQGAPAMSAGPSLSLSVPLEVLAATGVSDGSGNDWDLVASGEVAIDAIGNCSDVGATRVFGGTNCTIGFTNSGPTAPGVFDVIPFPTQDLPGPPDDNAPEVVTNCNVGSTDFAYDVNTGAPLGSNPCGSNPPEQDIGNTNSNTLDYIATPDLAPFQEVGVIETMPGSTYVSATSVPPQLSAVSVSGSQATFTYYGTVVCETDSSDADEWSQFTYVTPYDKTTLAAGDLVYATAIACPPSGGGTSITVTWPDPIPASSGVRFKYDGFGGGHSIVGAPGSAFAAQREASESAYAGPAATIDSYTPQSSTLPSSGGANVNVTFATTNTSTCSLSAVSVPAGAAALSLPSVSCSGGATIGVPANTSYAANAVYAVTLTAAGAARTPAAKASITITVPAAPLPPPADISPPAISGTAALGQLLTEIPGSWSSDPTSYSRQWEDCDSAGNNCSIISGATAQAYAPTTADVGHTLRVLETASNETGVGTAAPSAASAVVNPSTAPAPVPVASPVSVPVNGTPPTVAGFATVGRTLTEVHGSWSNAPTSFADRWERCGLAANDCVALAGAVAQTYAPTSADVGRTLRVQETASNGSGAGSSATSAPTAPVTAGVPHRSAPNTLLLEHRMSRHDHRATFRFRATGRASRFECALVREPARRGARSPAPHYISCGSPKTFTHLKAGDYVLYVRAIGPAGADKTPASYRFTFP